jgi:hyperosmotically inducible periplasmic protein
MWQSNKRSLIVSLSLVLATAFIVLPVQTYAVDRPAAQDQARESRRLAREIRHELLTLPWYGAFDWLEGTVSPEGVVTLRGWVVRPTTKSDAEARVREIEGVTKLNSEIKVLPLSPNDDRLRRAVFFALFGNNSPLFRYALGANPAIHIIVENGRVTLKGVVSSESDRNLANVKARGVSGVFEVRNELAVEGS